MKSFNFEYLESLSFYSEKKRIKDAVCNKSWCIYNENGQKILYIFQKDGRIIKSIDGDIIYCNYIYMKENDSIIVQDESQYMIKLVFCGDDINILQIEGQNGYVILLREDLWECLSNDPNKLEQIFNYEMQKRAKEKEKKLTKSFIRKTIDKIVLWYVSLVLFHVICLSLDIYHQPEHMFLPVLGMLIGCVLLIIISINMIVNKVVKRNDKISIQEWKERHPKNPMTKYLH